MVQKRRQVIIKRKIRKHHNLLGQVGSENKQNSIGKGCKELAMNETKSVHTLLLPT